MYVCVVGCRVFCLKFRFVHVDGIPTGCFLEHAMCLLTLVAIAHKGHSVTLLDILTSGEAQVDCCCRVHVGLVGL